MSYLVKLARKPGVKLRQSYVRLGKFARIRHQRYAHAKQFKRANRALKTLRTYLGRVSRKITGDTGLKEIFGQPLRLARRVREQRRRQRGLKVYSLHAPEVACIGKGKAHRPYDLASKSRSSHRSTVAGAASSWLTSRLCPAIPMTVTPWQR